MKVLDFHWGQSQPLLIVVWFVAYIHERRKCQLLLEVGENKIMNFFHIQMRDPLNSIHNLLLQSKVAKKGLPSFGSASLAFFCFFYELVKFFSTFWPLCLFEVLFAWIILPLALNKTGSSKCRSQFKGHFSRKTSLFFFFSYSCLFVYIDNFLRI